MIRKSRPNLKTRRAELAYDSPEELFAKLPGRSESHGFLRVAQADALRAYTEHLEDKDIAFELPTDTGKTAVGLLIADNDTRQGRVRAVCKYQPLLGQISVQINTSISHWIPSTP